MAVRDATNAFVAGIIIGLPLFLVVAKLFIWGIPALRSALDAVL